jgi:hypothetical protein
MKEAAHSNAAPAGTVLLQVVRCHGMDQLHEAVQQAVKGPTVLLLSTSVDPELKGTPAGVAAELQQVEAAHAAVHALQKKQVTMYAVQPQLEDVGGESLQARRRRLAAAGAGVKADVGVCGQLCLVSVWRSPGCSVLRCRC